MKTINKILIMLAIIFAVLATINSAFAQLNDTVTDAWLFDGNLNNKLAGSIVLTDNATSNEQGYINQGREFVKVAKDYITGSGHKTNLEIADNWTVNLWFNWSSLSTGTLYSNTGGSTERVVIGVLSSGQVGCALYNGGWLFRQGESTFSDLTSWHMLTFTNNGGSSPKCYLDGVAVSDLVSPATSTTAGFFLGTNSPSGDFFNGRMDEVTIFSQPLTQSQITDMYNKYNLNNTQYPWSITTTNVTITANDYYNSSSLTTFNATITYDGITRNYVTTTGTIITNITKTNGYANITIKAENYFNNQTINHNTTNDYAGKLYPHYAVNITPEIQPVIPDTTNNLTYYFQYNSPFTNLSYVNCMIYKNNIAQVNVIAPNTPRNYNKTIYQTSYLATNINDEWKLSCNVTEQGYTSPNTEVSVNITYGTLTLTFNESTTGIVTWTPINWQETSSYEFGTTLGLTIGSNVADGPLKVTFNNANNATQYYEFMVSDGTLGTHDQLSVIPTNDLTVMWLEITDTLNTVIEDADVRIYMIGNTITNGTSAYEFIGRRLTDSDGKIFFYAPSTKQLYITVSQTGYETKQILINANDNVYTTKENALTIELQQNQLITNPNHRLNIQKTYNDETTINGIIIASSATLVTWHTDYNTSTINNNMQYTLSGRYPIELINGTHYITGNNIKVYVYVNSELRKTYTIEYKKDTSKQAIEIKNEVTTSWGPILFIGLIIISLIVGIMYQGVESGIMTFKIGALIIPFITGGIFFILLAGAIILEHGGKWLFRTATE